MNNKGAKNYFKDAKNIPYLPLHYQFIEGNYWDVPLTEKERSSNCISVDKYQTEKCLPYSHYKPISKIVDETL